jgi:hypothetical protein
MFYDDEDLIVPENDEGYEDWEERELGNPDEDLSDPSI